MGITLTVWGVKQNSDKIYKNSITVRPGQPFLLTVMVCVQKSDYYEARITLFDKSANVCDVSPIAKKGVNIQAGNCARFTFNLKFDKSVTLCIFAASTSEVVKTYYDVIVKEEPVVEFSGSSLIANNTSYPGGSTVKVVKGSTVTVQAWVKASNQADVKLEVYDQYQDSVITAENVSLSNSWKQVKLSFEVDRNLWPLLRAVYGGDVVGTDSEWVIQVSETAPSPSPTPTPSPSPSPTPSPTPTPTPTPTLTITPVEAVAIGAILGTLILLLRR